MDPLVATAGGALVTAMATDAWQRVRDAVAAWWRSRAVRPGGPPGAAPEPGGASDDAVVAALDGLRGAAVAVRDAGDAAGERELAGQWSGWMQGLLAADPALADGLRRLLEEHLVPALPPAEQERARAVVMHGEARDHGRVYMAGRDLNITET